MTVRELADVLYDETQVEICIDFEPVFRGLAEDARFCRHINRQVDEVYINVDGTKLVVSITQERNNKKK